MTAVLTVEVEDAKLRAGHVLVGLTVIVSAAVVQALMAGIVEVRMCAMADAVVEKVRVLRVDTCDGLSDELSRANDRCFDAEVTMTERQFVSRAIAVRENHIRCSVVPTGFTDEGSSLVVHDS